MDSKKKKEIKEYDERKKKEGRPRREKEKERKKETRNRLCCLSSEQLSSGSRERSEIEGNGSMLADRRSLLKMRRPRFRFSNSSWPVQRFIALVYRSAVSTTVLHRKPTPCWIYNVSLVAGYQGISCSTKQGLEKRSPEDHLSSVHIERRYGRENFRSENY